MADWGKILSRGNVEDRRVSIGGLGGLGVIGTVLVLAFSFFTGQDPAIFNDVLNQLQQSQVSQHEAGQNQFEGTDSYETFASAVLGSSNDMWREIFAENNLRYEEPRLVLFRQATQSACGLSTSSVGPHYCPIDKTIYLDETFFDELQKRFGAQGGDVAEAYVIAHEVGHHAQNLLGILEKAQADGSNEASIKTELQADCFAGVWARTVASQGVLEKGEINEAIDAAAAVGDDRIQSSVQGRINPETWTHGSSEQRVEWFNRGYDSGQPSQCNTF